MGRRAVEVVPFERDVRSARRGGAVGALLGVIGSVVAGARYGGSAAEVAGTVMILLGGGVLFGVSIALGPPSRFSRERPESKGRFVALLLGVAVVCVAVIVLGAFVAGATGDP